MRIAPESLRLVNSGGSPGETPVSEVEIGRYYGEIDDRSLRVVYNERTLHPFQPYMFEAMANQIEYFEKVFRHDSGLDSYDQVWYWKELLGLLLIVIVQYTTFAMTGTVYWTDGWLYVNLLFAVVPMMFVLPYFNRYFFRLTGSIWLGPMITSMIFIMVLISNTVFYLSI